MQTYSNWECLVIDDGSSDETDSLMQAFLEKDNRFRYYKRPKTYPKGANACRNYGFEKSKGDFINWFDSDDIMYPEKLERQISVLQSYPEAPYCICQTNWVDKNTNVSLGLRANEIDSDNRFEDYVLNKIFWSILAPIWRKSFLINNDLWFNLELHQSQEYDFHIRALAIDDNYIILNDPLATMYRHNGNLSNDIHLDDNKLKSNLTVKKMVFDNFSQKLSHYGKLKLHKTLTVMLKQLLIFKNFKISIKYIQSLISVLRYIDLPRYKKLIYSVKLFFIFISYRIFGIGYRLLKPLK